MQEKIKEWLLEDQAEITDFLAKLVACHSEKDIEDTRASMQLVQNFLNKTALSFEEITHTPKMPNLLTSIQGKKEGKHLMLNGHLDVLPPGDRKDWHDLPFSGKVQNGRIFGRGVADMKAGVVAMLYAYRYASRFKENLAGKLSLSIVSDEESGWGRGTGYLFQKAKTAMLADAVLLAEPTQAEGIAIASKGYTQFEITIKAKGAITGYNNLVTDPVIEALKLITELKKLEELRFQLPAELAELFQDDYQEWYEERFGKNMTQQLAKVTFDISELHAGDSPIMLPNEVSMSVMMVSPVGSKRQNILARVRRIVKKYPNATMHVLGGDDGEYSSPKHPLFECLRDNIQKKYGTEVKPVPEIAISDARYWRYRGIPAYWYGLNGVTVGMPNESVVIAELLGLIEIYTLTILSYLK